jgi:N-acetylglucosaminyldiphosphoundecaprenol N-acetyl-beta-D-mannosaminyltransferase
LADILGVEFYPVTLGGALSTMEWMLSQEDGRTRLVVTANPIMVMTAQKDPEFMEILRRADLIVPDGVGILWAARRKGLDLPERVTGVELAYAMLGSDVSPKVFFLGGKEGVAEKAAQNAREMFPGVRISGAHHGYFSSDEESEVVEAIRDNETDVLFCAMGSPKQEKFIWKHKNELGAKVGIGVGGVLDVLAGEKKRAPELVQRLGLEWLYRLILEPSRIKQDVLLLEFAARVFFSGSDEKEDRKLEG